MTAPIIDLHNLAFSYHAPVFTNLNACIYPGDIIGIIGPNGSGKSTLLKLINGLLTPASGHVTIHGQVLRELSARRIARQTAFVPQQTVVSHGFTAIEIVLMGRFPYKSSITMETAKDIKIAKRAMTITGASSLANRRFDTLSGGEQQRVILASALAQEPEILLLDEPTSALDLYYQLRIFEILTQLNNDSNLTIAIAVHDLNLAASFCNRIWLLGSENELLDGTPETIMTPSVLEPVFRVQLTQLSHSSGRYWLIPALNSAQQT